MRFASVEHNGNARWGIVTDTEIALIDAHATLLDAISANALGSLSVDDAAEIVSLAAVTWLPLIERPGKILCAGLNYEDHRKETGRAPVTNPTIFTRFSDSQVAHNAPIVRPPESEQLDYEGELAVVIGRSGRRISAAEALDFVAGYSCYNDGSVRDWQAHTIQFTPGKNWPQTGAFGPWLVTPDEFGPLGPQRLETRLNGKVMQSAILADMIFSVPRLIEYISTFTPLNAGDVIVSGTPGGVGVKRAPQVFMAPGDVVEVEISGIGTLINPISCHS